MAIQGQPIGRREKKMMYNWAAAFGGIALGALGGTVALGQAVHNLPMAAAIGAAVGAVVGYTAPLLVRLMKAH